MNTVVLQFSTENEFGISSFGISTFQKTQEILSVAHLNHSISGYHDKDTIYINPLAYRKVHVSFQFTSLKYLMKRFQRKIFHSRLLKYFRPNFIRALAFKSFTLPFTCLSGSLLA